MGMCFINNATGTLSEYFSGWTYLPLMFFLIGMALLIVEIIVPGFGIFGIGGAISLIVAVVIPAKTFTQALLALMIVLIIIGIFAFLLFRSFNKGKISKTSLVLDDSVSKNTEGALEMLGRKGIVVNDLRPSGFAEFDGKRINVVTSGEFINKGEEVEIIAVEGNKVVVQAAAQK